MGQWRNPEVLPYCSGLPASSWHPKVMFSQMGRAGASPKDVLSKLTDVESHLS